MGLQLVVAMNNAAIRTAIAQSARVDIALVVSEFRANFLA